MDLPGIPEICVALICCVIFTYTYYCFRRAKVGWSFKETPQWILLNIHQLHQIAMDLMVRYDGTYLFPGKWYGISDIVVTVDSANINYVTTSNFANYPRGDEYRKILDIMGYALFTSDDRDWIHHRRLLHSPLKSRNYFNNTMKITRAKLERVLVPLLKHASEHNDKNFSFDMQDVIQRFTMDVVCKSITGHDSATLSIDLDFPNVPFLGALADFERSIVYRSLFPEFLWKLQLMTGLGPENKMIHARGVISSYISSIVSKKRHQVISNNDDDDEDADLLSLLMKDVNDDKFLQDTTLQQLLAGRDTTSSALTWFIWLIALHPEFEEKIRTEIIRSSDDIPGGNNAKKWRIFSSDETSNKLLYLHAALYESMRLYPPVPFQYRSAKELDVLPSGHRVRPKTKVVMPLYAMARMKALWGDNCSKFDPERWLTEQGTIKHEPSNKFVVFYAGPRSCMGKEVAMTQMKMVAATLIHNFRFQRVQGQNIQPDVSMILHVKDGLKMKFHSRWT